MDEVQVILTRKNVKSFLLRPGPLGDLVPLNIH